MIRGFGLLALAATLATAGLTASHMAPQQRPSASTPQIGPGIPLTLAQDRARRVSDLRYRLHLSIPAGPASPIAGRVTLTFTLSDAATPLALDFADPKLVRSVRVGGTSVTPSVAANHIVIPAADLRTGKNDIDIIWMFDMMEEVGSFPHNLSNSSPTYYQNLIFVNTSNGQDESHVNIPSPKAPAIIAIDRTTGREY